MSADASSALEPEETREKREAHVAEQERQFRETLEYCPAGLLVVDEDGRLLFHNARLRQLLGYEKTELELFDTRRFWHDLDQRSRILEILRERGGQLLNQEVVWKTKQDQSLHLLISYVQVAYRGGHTSFVGGKRVVWVYDVTSLKQREAQVAEQERQFREILHYCPAALVVVDDDGRLLFHNARLQQLFGYREEELELFDTRQFWHDLEQRSRIVEALREQGGQLLDQEVVWKTKGGEPVHSLISYVQVANQYLAPQVYKSIFTGRQDVRIASQRKKLTVCFSDIADFTETADKLEWEDLTQHLNHYLTEMSKIATEYGATIDKYVGDAIVMFFGDPETRGVKEDALACVKMALAMQKRIGELALLWRDAGIEMPLRCRIGIHTGYCTVGNFGGEDRMDYTIIGGGVNLASRLEHEASPGSVLISFETYAHVKDEVHCEKQGQIRVKGLAYPVATYRVVDLKANLAAPPQAMRTELPHLRLEVDPALMSADERQRAARSRRSADARQRACRGRPSRHRGGPPARPRSG